MRLAFIKSNESTSINTLFYQKEKEYRNSNTMSLK